MEEFESNEEVIDEVQGEVSDDLEDQTTTVEKGANETTDDPEPKPEDIAAKEKKRSAQARINEVYGKWKSAERRIAELEGQLTDNKRTVDVGEKPKADSFDTDEDYYEALADWKVSQKLNSMMQEQDEA